VVEMVKTEFGELPLPEQVILVDQLKGLDFLVVRFRWDGVQFRDGYCRLQLTALWVDAKGTSYRLLFPGPLEYEGPRSSFRRWLANELKKTGMRWPSALNALCVNVEKPDKTNNRDFI